MDPLSVVKMLWRNKWVVLPMLLITLFGASYIYFLAPRTYEASATYALLNPSIPSAEDIKANPALAKLNSNNPYLRSSDAGLIAEVLITKITSPTVVDKLHAEGLDTEFTVSRNSVGFSGLVIQLTASGHNPQQSIDTTNALGKILASELYSIQKVNGAADMYLFTALEVQSPTTAKEQFSNRARSLIMVLVGGAVLIFTAVSISQSVQNARRRSRASAILRQDISPSSHGPHTEASPQIFTSGPSDIPPDGTVKVSKRLKQNSLDN